MLRFILAAAICAVSLNSSAVQAQSQRPSAPPAESAGRTQLQPAGGNSATGQKGNTVGRAAVRPVTQTTPAAGPQPADDQQLPEELERLLKTWADASAMIKRLEGEHLRRVYDKTFEIEKLSEGKFYFEFPDKGRIDVLPTEITQKMIEQRNKGEVPALKKKNEDGTLSDIPYELKADLAEKWICDGLRVYDIDVEKEEAHVVQLPPDLQGTNIMDSPLPFLFGMPPEKAKRRFLLSFTRPFDPKSGVAHLTAEPRLPQDAQNWKKADVILDLKTFLPMHVRLTDPTGNEVTVYSFTNMEINKRDWLRLPGITKKDLFTPDLRDLHVYIIGTDAQPQSAQPESPSAIDQPQQALQHRPFTMPDVKGLDYQKAVLSLEQLGLKRNAPDEERTILLTPGPVAARAEDIYKVQSQNPAAGTLIQPGMKVSLTIWNKPATDAAKR